ncbi:MAG: hypothetical protein EA397_14545 [Deltaproteobacteria bacterium]|nr:MAG: hypothetical protein EA397_14545 [Deltaproteobacteria bacterium]
MKTLAPGLHVHETHQRFYGLEVGARMTVLELRGGLLIHSPIGVDPASVQALGPLRWVLAPNLLHHLYAGPWIDAGAEGWAAPGLPQKRPDLSFTGVIGEAPSPFGDEVELLPLRSFPIANEVALLHRASRTLVLTDLVFNFQPTAPLLTRAAMFCLCGYPGCRTTLLERATMKRALAREELTTLLSWDFDRLIMAHGQIIEQDGRRALERAYAWLL